MGAWLGGMIGLDVENSHIKKFEAAIQSGEILLLASGHGLIHLFGGFAALPVHVHAMTAVGYLMAAIFAFIYFVPYARLRRAVAGEDWKAGAAAQDLIRRLVGTNLVLGLANVALVFVLPAVGV
jgi:uncharacterized membrane protein